MSKIEKNKELCKKYHFLIPTNRWTGDIVKDYDYTWTELDSMPEGWRKSFGENLCKEIKEALDKIDEVHSHKVSSNYRILQIKEKYGRLRWYTNWSTKELDDIIYKYEDISIRTCIDCGEPATKITLNWISPYCEDCSKNYSKEKIAPIEEYLKGESYENNSKNLYGN